MISLTMKVNNHTDVVSLQAIRIHPINREPVKGDLCTYSLYVDGKVSDSTVVCAYGDPRRLGVSMLQEAMMGYPQ